MEIYEKEHKIYMRNSLEYGTIYYAFFWLHLLWSVCLPPTDSLITVLNKASYFIKMFLWEYHEKIKFVAMIVRVQGSMGSTPSNSSTQLWRDTKLTSRKAPPMSQAFASIRYLFFKQLHGPMTIDFRSPLLIMELQVSKR